MGVAKLLFGLRTCQPMYIGEAVSIFDNGLRRAIEAIVDHILKGCGIDGADSDYGYALDRVRMSLPGFDLSVSFDLSPRQKAVVECLRAPRAQNFLTVIPIEGLGQHMSALEYRTILKYRLMIPLFPVDEPCPVCRKVCLDSFGEHAVHCKELPGFKYRHDLVRDVLYDVLKRAGISSRKEAPVNFLTDPLEGRSTLRPADILVFGWAGGKHACVDLTGVSPLVGLRDNGFVAGQAALKAESSKVAKHEKACLENQHVFIPFAFDTFGFLAPEAEEFLNRVQRVVQNMGDDVDINTLTMEQYLALIQDNIIPSLVKPEISYDVEFKINSNFMRELRCKIFVGADDEDAHEHVRRGSTLRWKNRLSAGSITTWDLLEKAFIKQYCPPFKTAKKLEGIQDKAVEQSKYIGYLEETIIKYCDESIRKQAANDEWIRKFIENTDSNLRALDTTTRNLQVKSDQLTQMVLTNAGERVKTKTKMGKKVMKESVPHDLPVVHHYVPPTSSLGHLKEQKGNPYKTRETVCMIGIPKKIHKKKAQEDERDMDNGPVHDEAKVVREEEQDYDIPLQDGVMQPLTSQIVHITPPDDDYVAPATNPILDKYLNEFGKEFFDMTEVDENGKFIKDIKELSIKTHVECETFIQKLINTVLTTNDGIRGPIDVDYVVELLLSAAIMT
ncbi:hypothetical protein Tco_0072491 [Tanacetum coccineum]